MQRRAILDDERLLADLHVRLEAQFLLGVLGCPPEPSLRRGASAEVNAILILKCLRQVLGEQIVEVVAAELIVPVTRQDFGDIAFDRDH